MVSNNNAEGVDNSDCVGEVDEVLDNSMEGVPIGWNFGPSIGMEFKSEEAARIVYNEYAKSVGIQC